MSDGETVLCCVPVENLPVPEPGSVRSVCQNCEVAIWISLKGMRLVERKPKTRILCTRCVLAENPDPEQFNPLPGEDRALKRWFNQNKQEVFDELKRRADD